MPIWQFGWIRCAFIEEGGLEWEVECLVIVGGKWGEGGDMVTGN